MVQRQSELELAVTETVLAQPTKIRRNAKKKIRIRVWKTYRIVPWVLFTLLTSISIYTLLTMDYGEVVLLDATRQFFTDLQRIFLQPRLSGRFSFETLLQALGMTVGLAVITTLLGGVTAFLMALFTARNISHSCFIKRDPNSDVLHPCGANDLVGHDFLDLDWIGCECGNHWHVFSHDCLPHKGLF